MMGKLRVSSGRGLLTTLGLAIAAAGLVVMTWRS